MLAHMLRASVAAMVIGTFGPAFGQAAKAPSEIVIGQTAPYSGPASGFSASAKATAAFFAKVNADGGINGRKIRLLSLDDGYNPAKTVEQTRKLVEQDNVLFLFNSPGAAPNSAVHKYLNSKKVPQLFVASGSTKWNDPKDYPWTIGGFPSYDLEGRIFTRYVLANVPNAKIAILYQNDDYGKDYRNAVRAELGEANAAKLVAEQSYEVTDPTVDSQLAALQSSGANVLLTFATPKHAALAIRRVYDSGWKPLHLIGSPASSVGSVLKPAGIEKSVGLITSQFIKDPNDSRWHQDQDYKDWLAWMRQYHRDGNEADFMAVYGYVMAELMTEILRRCGDDLSRENIMKQVASLEGLNLPMMLPGIKLASSGTDYSIFKGLQLQRFDGNSWALFGDIVGSK